MMKKLKQLAMAAFFSIAILSLLSGCGKEQPQSSNAGSSDKIIITDALGRQVELNTAAKRIVAVGPGALRLYCYAGDISKVVGVEARDAKDAIGRSYLYAYPELMKLPIIGAGGPNNAPDPEKLLAVKPDVILSTYATEAAMADKLQAKTGVPVVALNYGINPPFDENVRKSLAMIGKVTDQVDKADKNIKFIEACQADLSKRTANIAADKRPSVYVGALNKKGSHGIESTWGQYSLLQALNTKSVVDSTGAVGSIMIDKEKLLEWNPQIIFIDEGGYNSVQQDMQKNPEYYNSLRAFQNQEIYAQLPYNFYANNIDTAIVDAYYLGKILYPEAFSDVEPLEKADEIYMAMLGKAVYKNVAKDFGGLKKLTF